MIDDDRPHLHCLVAYVSPVFGLVSEPRVMPLEDAVDYAHAGFAVLVDPQDERDLAMYERLERAAPRKSKVWYRR